MTDTPEIARIRAAVETWLKAVGIPAQYDARSYLNDACNPSSITAVLAHIDAQAAEIERLRADALRIEALEKLNQSHMSTDMHLGRACTVAIYQRTGIGSQIYAGWSGTTVREAIDAAMKEQQ